jgi:23S rRNA pseudouridine1911/1915/1917 synthase
MADLRAWNVDAKDAGTRVDRFLDACMDDASRTRVQKWIADGCVYVNRKPARKSLSLEAGDTVTLALPEAGAEASRAAGVEPEDIPLNVVYEDRHLAVIDKPKGLVTHPGHGEPSGTLANALAFRFRTLSDLGGGDRPGIVHRLDRDTSGVIVMAFDEDAHRELSRQFHDREHEFKNLLTTKGTASEGPDHGRSRIHRLASRRSAVG